MFLSRAAGALTTLVSDLIDLGRGDHVSVPIRGGTPQLTHQPNRSVIVSRAERPRGAREGNGSAVRIRPGEFSTKAWSRHGDGGERPQSVQSGSEVSPTPGVSSALT